MSNIEQCLEYLGETNDALRIQNHVLTTATRGLIRAFPPETAQDAVESIRLAFEDTLDELNCESSLHINLFHGVTYIFFREKGR